MSGPASARPRLAGPGPAPRAPRSPSSARRSPQSQRPRRRLRSTTRWGRRGCAGRGEEAGYARAKGAVSRAWPAPLRSAARPLRQRRERPRRLPGERRRVPAALPGSGRCRAPGALSGPGLARLARELRLRQESERLLPRGTAQGWQRREWGSGRGTSGSSSDLITSNTLLTGAKDEVTI